MPVDKDALYREVRKRVHPKLVVKPESISTLYEFDPHVFHLGINGAYVGSISADALGYKKGKVVGHLDNA